MKTSTGDAAVLDQPAPASVVAAPTDYPEFGPSAASAPMGSIDHLLDVSVRLSAELGRVELSIGDVLKLGPGAVVALDRSVVELVDLLVQGVPFARGEVVVVDDRFAIRIREIVDPKHLGKE